ncbi:MAG: hypothetical protein E3J60_00545 [Dehalococcoidia bacterium]|nr:MAG: hypothetical protein E3J60_00545 [Dehalococcoidia bacterium]
MSKLITEGRYAGMIAKAGNCSGAAGAVAVPGVVVTSGAALDLLHIIPAGRSFYVTKIAWYNPGVAATLQFGTQSNAPVPAMVPLFPLQAVLAGLGDVLVEEQLLGVEFMLNSLAAPNGWNGSLYVTASIALIQISVEVAEKS